MPAPSSSTAPRYFSGQVHDSNRFYLDVNPGKRRDLTVVSGGWEQCRPDYEITRAGFPFPIIEFVARGAGTLVLTGRVHEIGPGSVFAYGRGIPHRITAHPGTPMTKYFVAFAGRSALGLLRECRILPQRVIRVTHPERTGQVFDDLIRHGLSDHANRARMCAITLQYLVMIIADHAAPHGEVATQAYATYLRCRGRIEAHYPALRSLSDVASACNIDSAYLCRLFQRFGRQSPYQYLQQLRMNRAADLLQNSDRLVKEVAAELGFGDPYNFARSFRRVFGVYPGQMHRRHGNSGP